MEVSSRLNASEKRGSFTTRKEISASGYLDHNYYCKMVTTWAKFGHNLVTWVLSRSKVYVEDG